MTRSGPDLSASSHVPRRSGGQDGRIGAGRIGIALVAVLLLLMVGVVVLFPIGTVVVGLVRSALRAGAPTEPATEARAFSAAAIGWTVVYAASIAGIAVVLGLPAAWAMRSRRFRAAWTGIVAVPLLMPSYLAYAGWGLLRAPGTGVGDWVARQDSWVPMAVGRVLAVMGLGLWVWPLAAFIMAGAAARVPGSVLDAMRSDGAPWWRRGATVLRLMFGGIAAAAGAVVLVMLGSAIPLHVAQATTYALHLWQVMNLTPEMGQVWKASWPLALVAAAAAAVVTRRSIGRWRTEERASGDDSGGSRGTGRWSFVLVGAALALSVAAPLLLFGTHLRKADSLKEFWVLSGGAVVESLGTAAAVGGVGVAACLCTWTIVFARPPLGRVGWTARAAAVGVLALAFAGLMPGVLVGAAVNAAFSPEGLRWVSDSTLIVVIAHAARFAFLGGLLGCWLGRLESPEERLLRAVDGADGLRAWAALRLPISVAAAVGAGLAIMALSFHEIESTVMVLPPGADNLAQQLLDYLHFARDEQLSAAAVNLLLGGLAVAAAAGVLVSRPYGRAPDSNG